MSQMTWTATICGSRTGIELAGARPKNVTLTGRAISLVTGSKRLLDLFFLIDAKK